MKFTKIRDIRYINKEETIIDLFCTCDELGEIEMTLNLKDTEDVHTFFDGKNEYALEEYCKKQNVQNFKEDEMQLEIKRVSEIKKIASSLIISKYPEYKQLNIIRLGGKELQEMSEYIDSIREISNSAENNKTNIKDIIWNVL